MRLFEVAGLVLLLAAATARAGASADWKPDWPALKTGWKRHIERTLAAGRLPIIDVENNYNPTYMNADAIHRDLEERGVVIVAWSPEEEHGLIASRGLDWWLRRWPRLLQELTAAHAEQALPVPPAGGFGLESRHDLLDAVLRQAERGGYPMLGEYFFRHYSSDQDIEVGAPADISIPIDGPLGKRLFAFSARTGKPFELHYETEDALIAPLEKMLSKYPKARVIWCHAGRVRRPDKARRFMKDPAGQMRRLIEAHANLFFDLSSLGPAAYPGTGEGSSPWWDMETLDVRPEWQRLVIDHPWRFMAGLDTGMDRAQDNPGKAAIMERFLASFPPETRAIVAYRAAWKLLFGETLPAELPAPAKE